MVAAITNIYEGDYPILACQSIILSSGTYYLLATGENKRPPLAALPP